MSGTLVHAERHQHTRIATAQRDKIAPLSRSRFTTALGPPVKVCHGVRVPGLMVQSHLYSISIALYKPFRLSVGTGPTS